MAEQIGRYITHIPAGESPLSSDVFLVRGESRWYLFDVGRNQESLDAILALEGEKTVILSHFHRDHVANLDRITYDTLYVGDLTAERLKMGAVVSKPRLIEDGVCLEIRPCPSPHTGGSLILTVDREYTLLGDLYFSRPTTETEQIVEMMQVLESLDTKYFVVSHQGSPVFEKELLLQELRTYYQLENQ